VQTRTDTPVLDQSSQLAVKGATQPDNWIDAERVARENALACYRNPALSSDRDPLAELARAHKLCLLRAADKGLDPDQPRSLARSIIMDS
jgi:glucosamine 6-phosphate synthetase-like amidotransferase/phosphosugar isomerase protein